MSHSQKERRYRCKRCCRTFATTKDTALYRMRKPKWLVVAVVTLLAYGCLWLPIWRGRKPGWLLEAERAA